MNAYVWKRPWCWLTGHRYSHVTDDIWFCARCHFAYEGPDDLYHDDPWMKETE